MTLDDDGGDNLHNTTSGKVACIQIGSVAFLISGFYYGLRQRNRATKKEFPLAELKNANHTERMQVTPKKYNRLELFLGLDKKLTANAAAWRSLVGGTLMSVAGCGVLTLGIAAIISVYNLTNFSNKMESELLGRPHSISRKMRLMPTEVSHELNGHDDDLEYLASIFRAAAVEDEEAYYKNDTQSIKDEKSNGNEVKRNL
ncbi:unnamed protein product [Albugo candida]|uniref:Transmembrane protein 242 n=2 Tax=Albugo candida TaxID=65357 RepID=A0A024GBV0_9STRA|nr:unnamed protein product [Albugo candida]|eukprot:CCI44243.1 unnamed protein product [Albugo candida]